ncbi:MAG TPA: cbb3-type cytochrome c oxidase subunit I, partial [Steroidobacteraceae bacterium]|nr:cbb3-type cytochrome c oxidase subunit I [Steroidobacteraceae bacterium]
VWVPTLGIVAHMLLVLPVVIFAVNFLGTLKGSLGAIAGSLTLRFIALSIAGFLAAVILGMVLAVRGVAAVTAFTLWETLRDWLALYACFSVAMFGAAYFYLPRLTGKVWRSPALTGLHFSATLLGVIAIFIGLAGAGCTQAHQLADASVAFAKVTDSLAAWHTFNSVGLGLLLLGNVAFFLNFVWIACPINSRSTATAEIPAPPALTLATKEGHA